MWYVDRIGEKCRCDLMQDNGMHVNEILDMIRKRICAKIWQSASESINGKGLAPLGNMLPSFKPISKEHRQFIKNGQIAAAAALENIACANTWNNARRFAANQVDESGSWCMRSNLNQTEDDWHKYYVCSDSKEIVENREGDCEISRISNLKQETETHPCRWYRGISPATFSK